MAHRVPTAYSRVTLVNGTRRVDLALPGALPLADVMPQLLRYCAPDEKPEQPALWTLGRLGGANLSLDQSLQDAAIVDGDVLELRAASTVVSSAYVEDVRDAVEDAVDESGRQWGSRTTVAFALSVGAVALLAAIALPQARVARDGLALATAVGIAGLGVLGGWWADRRGHPRVSLLVLAMGGAWAGVAGWLLATFTDAGWPTSVAAALVAALALTAAARTATERATAQLAATAVLCGAAVPLAVLADQSDNLAGVRVAAVLAILVVGVLPRTSLTVGGLAGADYRVRNFGLVTAEELGRRIRQSSALLAGSVLAASAVGLGTGLALALGGTSRDRSLAVALGLALLLRSRVFSRVPHLVPLRVAGLGVLLASGWRAVVGDPRTVGWLVGFLAVAAGLFVVLSAIPLSDVARARLKQLLNLAEMVVVVALVALAAYALGVFDRVSELSN